MLYGLLLATIDFHITMWRIGISHTKETLQEWKRIFKGDSP